MDPVAFQPISIGKLKLTNRFVRSATFEGMGTFEGRPTPHLRRLYFNLAEGGVGLIVTGLSHVQGYQNLPNVDGLPFPLAMHDDRLIPDWQEIVAGVHARGAKIAMQLIHLGRQEIPQLREPVAPSAVQLPGEGTPARELTAGEIQAMIDRFAQAIRRVQAAGFDAVQLHGGHGYLLSNFISPYFNVRADAYGGTTERRARVIVEIIEKARGLVGLDFPILIKMNSDDFLEGGLDKAEAVRLAKILAQAGVDAIEVTGGVVAVDPLRTSATGIAGPDDEAYFRRHAVAIKEKIASPVILVGGIRSFRIVEDLLSKGVADMIAMSRPFICEPGLVNRWRAGDFRKAECISCNKCRDHMSQNSLRCYLNGST